MKTDTSYNYIGEIILLYMHTKPFIICLSLTVHSPPDLTSSPSHDLIFVVIFKLEFHPNTSAFHFMAVAARGPPESPTILMYRELKNCASFLYGR
jgi:hypothetical protein